jgi:iron complex transport system substrate-binding protein
MNANTARLFDIIPKDLLLNTIYCGICGMYSISRDGKMKRIACSVMVIAVCASLAFMPAGASDFTLEIFGNANMDDTIDEQDIEYVQGIIDGTNDETDLADANYDGTIDEQDIAQIKSIIESDEKKITIIDSADRIVTVEEPIERVITLFLHPVETLRALNVPVEEIIVGLGYTDDVFYPELCAVQNVGCFEPSIEEILALHPDVVILHAAFGDRFDKVKEVCDEADITVIRLNLNQPVNYTDETKKLGYLFGKIDEAEALIDFRENILSSIQETAANIPEDEKPAVYYEFSNAYNSLGGEHSYIDFTGGYDIFNGASGSVNPEEVVAQNPDIIVKLVSYSEAGGYQLDADDTAGLEAIRDELMNRPELQNVNAVKTGKVYIITTEISSTYSNSCRSFLQVAYNAKWFHPDLFEDLDPQAIHQEYLTKFQGLDIDLNEKGVFVYPPLEEC